MAYLASQRRRRKGSPLQSRSGSAVCAGKSVSRRSFNPLEVHRGQAQVASPPDIESVASLPALIAAFRAATGWSVTFQSGPKPTHPPEHASSAPANPGVRATLGDAHLGPVRSASAVSSLKVERRAAQDLADALAALLAEHLQSRQALWEREAELATAVPVIASPSARRALARRIETILRDAAQAVGAHAAGLYLLDEGTTSLKLRSAWGLPPLRLADPPRPLEGALADLEAMLGHAVCLEDTHLLDRWNAPEAFPAAACVPVATPNTILGTLWVFARAPRTFDRRDTSLLEAVAGRLAAELERETLVRETVKAARLRRQCEAAEQLHRAMLPAMPPDLPGWELAGWLGPSTLLTEGFYDWCPAADGRIAAFAARTEDQGIPAAMTAQAIRAACRAHALHSRNPGALLKAVSADLWRASPGDQKAAAFCAILSPASSTLTWTGGGNVYVLLARQTRRRTLSSLMPPLGAPAEGKWQEHRHRLQSGDLLVAIAGYYQPQGGSIPKIPGISVPELALAASMDLAKVLERLAEQWESAIRASPTKGSPRSLPALLAIRRTVS